MKNEKMNKKIRLLIGGLVLLLASTATAMADTTPLTICGSVGSAADGNVAFVSATNGAAGSALVSGGNGTITCNGFTVPAGQTLTGLTVEVTDDALKSVGTNSQITWTWTYSGEPFTSPAASPSKEKLPLLCSRRAPSR